MIVAHLSTQPLSDHTAGEVGVFEQEVSVPDQEFLRIINRRDYLKKHIAATLAHAAYSTQVPLDLWVVSIPAPIALEYNLPMMFRGAGKRI